MSTTQHTTVDTENAPVTHQPNTGHNTEQTNLEQYTQPDTPGMYTRHDHTSDLAYWTAPLTVETHEDTNTYTHADPALEDEPIPVREQQHRHVIVDKRTGHDEYVAYTSDDGKPISHISDEATTIHTADTHDEAIEHVIEWMNNNQPADPDTVERPGDADRDRKSTYTMRDEADAIRDNTRVHVDNLPEAVVETTINHERNQTTYKCRTLDADQEFYLTVTDSTLGYTAYTLPSDDNPDAFHVAEHLTTSNEHNLRDRVHEPTYNTIKQHDKMIREDPDDPTRVEIIDIDETRDGYVNPTSGDVTDSRNAYEITSDEADLWHTIPDTVNADDLETGQHQVTTNGLVRVTDHYAVNTVIEPDTWNETNIAADTTHDDAIDTTHTVDAPTTHGRDRVTIDDPVTAVTGIGNTVADELGDTTKFGTLYKHGFVVPYISSQYVTDAISDMYTHNPHGGVDDAVRAVTGVLGGIAYDTDGNKIGTAAQNLLHGYSMNDATTAWVTPYHRVKDEYVPAWITDDDREVTSVGAGTITHDDIEDHVDDTTTMFVADTARQNIVSDTTVAVTGNDTDEYVTVDADALETAVTLADTHDPLARNTVTVWVTDHDTHDGIIHVHGDDVNAVVSTETGESVFGPDVFHDDADE